MLTVGFENKLTIIAFAAPIRNNVDDVDDVDGFSSFARQNSKNLTML